jgi:hypothetical protein
MKKPRCACLHPNATQCAFLRSVRIDSDSEDERCDCACHHEDEDGNSMWNDEGGDFESHSTREITTS